MNPRQEIVSLLRGYFACPVISLLGEMGLLSRMQEGTFSLSSFPEVPNTSMLNSLFVYLESLGLLTWNGTHSDACYQVSPLGARVFRRYGAFCLLTSYQDYMTSLRDRLFNTETLALPTVNRALNILGSGQVHQHKFFPAALELIGPAPVYWVVDIGCGDGRWLHQSLQVHPTASAIAVDYSKTAVSTTIGRLKKAFPGRQVIGVVGDGFDVDTWSAHLPESSTHERTIVSLWFALHEFCEGDPDKAVAFFDHTATRCPNAEIVLGELVAIPPEALAVHRDQSIMPEWLLFHSLSGQGVLSQDQYSALAYRIPYRLHANRSFDVISELGGREVPSSFIWHLIR